MGVPTILPLALNDRPAGKDGETLMDEIGPPEFVISILIPSLRTSENAVEVAFSEMDGACSTTLILKPQVWIAEAVVARMV